VVCDRGLKKVEEQVQRAAGTKRMSSSVEVPNRLHLLRRSTIRIITFSLCVVGAQYRLDVRAGGNHQGQH
jgi:hypothetical protein